MYESKGASTKVTAAWTRLGLFQIGGTLKNLVIDVMNTGSNAFTGFQVTRGATFGAHDDANIGGKTLLSGTDFNTASVELVDAVSSAGGTPNLHQIPAAGWGQLRLEHLEGTAEIAVWAQSTSGTQAIAYAGGE